MFWLVFQLLFPLLFLHPLRHLPRHLSLFTLSIDRPSSSKEAAKFVEETVVLEDPYY